MLLCGENLSFAYDKKIIFEGVNISICSDERVCLFAKSGYGKSTLAKVLAGYEKPLTGQILLDSKRIENKGFSPVQLIYQHPEKSVNPKWRIGKILSEGGEFDSDMLDKLYLSKSCLDKYPFELSGGELQRVCIARALKKETKFIIADEITTMLDAVTQANIWNFFLEEVSSRNIGLLFVTHNKFLADKICTRYADF